MLRKCSVMKLEAFVVGVAAALFLVGGNENSSKNLVLSASEDLNLLDGINGLDVPPSADVAPSSQSFKPLIFRKYSCTPDLSLLHSVAVVKYSNIHGSVERN